MNALPAAMRALLFLRVALAFARGGGPVPRADMWMPQIAGSDFGNTRSRPHRDVPAAAACGTGPPAGSPRAGAACGWFRVQRESGRCPRAARAGPGDSERYFASLW